MVAPQRSRRVRPSDARRPVVPAARRRPAAPAGASRKPSRRGLGARYRRFAVLVVVPVLLMLGSVYTHTVADALEGRTQELEERLARAEVESEDLEVQVTELSRPDRIRTLAREDLGLRDPDGKNLRVYGKDGEDGGRDAGETPEEGSG